ncbi:hypothetical protein Taro_015812 [Colocasia esculenta]|uniref:Uncharacterized protein n=1 Tax=Colocasia esculenta TaxID=4460 RepID=A0A843UIK3_COLES|nr:hypothetical protein [Colocasia esculenta]
MEKNRPFSECSAPYVGFGYEDRASSYSFNGPNGKESGFSTSADPELKRKKRIAAYNSFLTENKLKSSVRSSFKWIKSKFTDVRYG